MHQTQQAYERVLRKLDRLDYILSCLAVTVWGFGIGFCGYILIDFLVK